MKTLKQEYVKLLCNYITVCEEDLNDNESKLIEESYILFKNKLNDIKILNDEVYRLKIELANLRAMLDDKDY